MPIREKQLSIEAGTLGFIQPFEVVLPDVAITTFTGTPSVASASVGVVVPLVRNWMPIPGSVQFTVADSSGVGLSVTVEVLGDNQFGERVKEKLTSTGSATVSHSKNAFTKLWSVTITAISGNGAGDTAALGYGWANQAFCIGMPVRLKAESLKTVLRNGSLDLVNWRVNERYATLERISVNGAADDRLAIFLGPPFGPGNE